MKITSGSHSRWRWTYRKRCQTMASRVLKSASLAPLGHISAAKDFASSFWLFLVRDNGGIFNFSFFFFKTFFFWCLQSMKIPIENSTTIATMIPITITTSVTIASSSSGVKGSSVVDHDTSPFVEDVSLRLSLILLTRTPIMIELFFCYFTLFTEKRSESSMNRPVRNHEVNCRPHALSRAIRLVRPLREQRKPRTRKEDRE